MRRAFYLVREACVRFGSLLRRTAHTRALRIELMYCIKCWFLSEWAIDTFLSPVRHGQILWFYFVNICGRFVI